VLVSLRRRPGGGRESPPPGGADLASIPSRAGRQPGNRRPELRLRTPTCRSSA
jgi:hypothetical protein